MEARMRSLPSYPTPQPFLFPFPVYDKAKFLPGSHNLTPFAKTKTNLSGGKSLKELAGYTWWDVYMSTLFFLTVCCFKVIF